MKIDLVDKCVIYDDGMLMAKRHDWKMNLFRRNGGILSDEWLDAIWRYDNGIYGFAGVDGKNLVDRNGNIVFDEWLSDIQNFDEDGFAEVRRRDLLNLIDAECNLIFDEWVDQIGNPFNGCRRIRKGNEHNFVNDKGKIVSPNMWFDYVFSFDENGMAHVKKNGTYYYVDKDGVLYLDDKIHISKTRLPDNQQVNLKKK